MARPTPRTLSALATTMARVLAELVAAGKPVEPDIFAALDDVQRTARGERIAKAALTTAWKQLDARGNAARAWTDELTKRYFWAVSQTATVLWMAATGEDHHELVLRQGAYGLVGGDDAGRVDAWYAAALAVSTLPDAPPKPRRVAPRTAAAEARALARITKALGRKGSLITTKRARHDARRTTDATTLKRLLARHRYPVHASVLAFERTFGGLVIPEASATDDQGWFAHGPATLVGAFACLKSAAHAHPTGGREDLVPVAYTPNDGILYLDKAGRPFFQDTIEDLRAVALRRTAASAVAMLLDLA